MTHPTTNPGGLPFPMNRPPLQRQPPVQHGPAPTMTLPPARNATSGAHAAETVAVTLASAGSSGPNWDRAIRDVRTLLDGASAFHYETHSCGAEGVRRTMWWAEMPGESAPHLRDALERLARAVRDWARVTWAPCSPIDL
jgi:hypothetical protein